MEKVFYVDLYPGWHLNKNSCLIMTESIYNYAVTDGMRRVKVTVDLPEFGGETDEREAVAEVLK